MMSKYIDQIVMGALVIAALIFVACHELSQQGPTIARTLPNGYLIPAQEKSIDITLDLSHLMIAWAVSVIGATAFLVRVIIEQRIPTYRSLLYGLFSIVLFSALSLYFGLIGFEKTARMLAVSQLPLEHTGVIKTFGYQYATVLISTFCFGLCVVLLTRLMANRATKDIEGERK